jgi:hypothetical protein
MKKQLVPFLLSAEKKMKRVRAAQEFNENLAHDRDDLFEMTTPISGFVFRVELVPGENAVRVRKGHIDKNVQLDLQKFDSFLEETLLIDALPLKFYSPFNFI